MLRNTLTSHHTKFPQPPGRMAFLKSLVHDKQLGKALATVSWKSRAWAPAALCLPDLKPHMSGQPGSRAPGTHSGLPQMTPSHAQLTPEAPPTFPVPALAPALALSLGPPPLSDTHFPLTVPQAGQREQSLREAKRTGPTPGTSSHAQGTAKMWAQFWSPGTLTLGRSTKSPPEEPRGGLW